MCTLDMGLNHNNNNKLWTVSRIRIKYCIAYNDQ